ncbi:hypothetical protein ACNKHW_07930 [Shigella flexneri]
MPMLTVRWPRPARVLMQDFTAVSAVVNMAAMREAVKRLAAILQRSPTLTGRPRH